MTRNDQKKSGKDKKSEEKPSDPRVPHSIRFSGSEWLTIEKAAALHGIPVGELVRSGALAAGRGSARQASRGHIIVRTRRPHRGRLPHGLHDGDP